MTGIIHVIIPVNNSLITGNLALPRGIRQGLPEWAVWANSERIHCLKPDEAVRRCFRQETVCMGALSQAGTGARREGRDRPPGSPSVGRGRPPSSHRWITFCTSGGTRHVPWVHYVAFRNPGES